MILPYGPVPLTAGIVTSQDVDSSAAWVVVENVSLFLYLGVSFWPSKPPAVTSFAGQPWNAVIQPGGTLRIPCPAQGWLGKIWLLPVDASGQSAATGTVSSYSSALLRTYGPDDTPSDSPSVIRGLDILSQPRVISIPMTPAGCYFSGFNVTPGTDYTPFPGTVAVLNPNFDTGCVVYIYWINVTPIDVDGFSTFNIRLVCRDYTTPAIILANIDILGGFCGKTGNLGQSWPPSGMGYPYKFTAARGTVIPANTGNIEVALHAAAGTAAWPLNFQIAIDSDKLSPGQVTVPGIGQGLNPQQYAAGIPKF